MTERDAIQMSTDGPVTIDGLIHDLVSIGVESDMTLLVHSSLSAMGWVCGGPVAVVRALETVLGPTGTLVMPTHSADLSDPARWENPPVSPSWWEAIKGTMPPFDVNLTPTRGMGAVPECFRKQPGAVRSNHPAVSFAAWGRHAGFVVEGHSLDYGLGAQSPLARIYDLGGSVLLIGVSHDTNTSLHLAEYRAEISGKTIIKCGAPTTFGGDRQWETYDDLDLEEEDFPEIGRAYEKEGYAFSKGRVGYANSVLMPQRAMVDFAVEWMESHRT